MTAGLPKAESLPKGKAFLKSGGLFQLREGENEVGIEASKNGCSPVKTRARSNYKRKEKKE
jgi:hypothetical protein